MPVERPVAADGTDLRNYGGLNGLPELRAIFAADLQVPADQLLAAGNSSLELMHDAIVFALLGQVPGAERRWADEDEITFLCPVPGYDRHFGICERYGIEMIPVALTPDGPDMDEVERLVAADASIKGIWCVPKYSNPDGTTYSDETVRRLAAMPTAAPDFRIFWDNAYAVHHLTDEHAPSWPTYWRWPPRPGTPTASSSSARARRSPTPAPVSRSSAPPRRTSKWWAATRSSAASARTRSTSSGTCSSCATPTACTRTCGSCAGLIRPKFEAVDKILTAELGDTGLASWNAPTGGYFITLRVPEGCAADVVAKAKAAGIALTPAGATHPYGDDPTDSIIRIAPTYPELDELETAVAGLTVCVRLSAVEKLLS